MNRKKLLKLMGKVETYTATIQCINSDATLLLEVQHKGKEMSDHVWVNMSQYTKQEFKAGDYVSFKAKAYTYKDKQGNRKHGLNDCTGFCLVSTSESLKSDHNDRHQKFLRMNR